VVPGPSGPRPGRHDLGPPLGTNQAREQDENGLTTRRTIVIITGICPGAGRSTAAKSLEDLGWFGGRQPARPGPAARANGGTSRARVERRGQPDGRAVGRTVPQPGRSATDLKSADQRTSARARCDRAGVCLPGRPCREDTLVRPGFDSERRPPPAGRAPGGSTDGNRGAGGREAAPRGRRGDAEPGAGHQPRPQRARKPAGPGMRPTSSAAATRRGPEAVRGPRSATSNGLPVDGRPGGRPAGFLPNPHWDSRTGPDDGPGRGRVREVCFYPQPGAAEFLEHYAESFAGGWWLAGLRT